MIETVTTDAEIENLYKGGINAPYRKVQDGHGYYGVLISDKNTGKLHCHICGKWFKHLGAHAAIGHQVKAKDYKEKYGFTKRQPLCSNGISGARRGLALKNEKFLNSASKRLKGKAAWNRGQKRGKGWKSRSESFINSRAMCDEQIRERYVAVSDKVGHPASSGDLRRHDGALRLILQRKYGTFNEFCKKTGMRVPQKPSGPGRKVSKPEILLGVRECYRAIGHTPSTVEYRKYHEKRISKTYSDVTVFRHFGSWNRCLAAAGLR